MLVTWTLWSSSWVASWASGRAVGTWEVYVSPLASRPLTSPLGPMLAVFTWLWVTSVTKLVKLKARGAVVGAGLRNGESVSNNPGSISQVRHGGRAARGERAARVPGAAGLGGVWSGAGTSPSCRLLPGHWVEPEVNGHAALELLARPNLGTTRAGSRSARAWPTAVRRARWARAA